MNHVFILLYIKVTTISVIFNLKISRVVHTICSFGSSFSSSAGICGTNGGFHLQFKL